MRDRYPLITALRSAEKQMLAETKSLETKRGKPDHEQLFQTVNLTFAIFSH